jgi:hypothetical protein
MEDSIPRWKTSDIDEHVAAKLAGYEAALDLLEGILTGVRNRVKLLEAENELLKWELVSPRRDLMRPPVIKFFGFQMEGADVD